MAKNIKPEHDCLPKTGRVNAVCKEWSVREDGALAYHLQNKEISEHLQSNKFKNAVVRQDFPHALDEQIREQQLAEQAAAVYHQMLAEQEEIDNLYAQQLAHKLEVEEKNKRKYSDVQNERIVRNMIQNEYENVSPSFRSRYSPQETGNRALHRLDTHDSNHHLQSKFERVIDKRQGSPMSLPQDKSDIEHLNTYVGDENIPIDHYLYTEPYKVGDTLANRLDKIEIAEVGLPINDERVIQEQKDALLARQLQHLEDSTEESQLNRDRLLAIEAQDKELAKLLQERERQKAKRAKERAKQKAIAKKQQQIQEQKDMHQIMPDDSYSDPADLLPTAVQNINISRNNAVKYIHNQSDLTGTSVSDDINYSFPVDVLSLKNQTANSKSKNYYYQKNCDSQGSSKLHHESFDETNNAARTAIRPNHLDIKISNYPAVNSRNTEAESQEIITSSPQHVNIAMAIDPTYNRKSKHSTPYHDTSSSTVTTSTSSSSLGMFMSPPELSEQEDDGPIPPYMPIQGQRRTASLEKKAKKKSKDGCKQQ